MRAKAVIFRPDRTNSVITLGRKDLEGKSFRHDKNQYFLHPDRFQVTWVRKPWPFVRHFSTFYYSAGHPFPLPVPDFQKVEEVARDATGAEIIENVLDDKGNQLYANGDGKLYTKPKEGTHPVTRKKMTQTFPKAIDLGVSAEELAAIFNPWFYRIIAPSNMTTREKILILIVAATLAVSLYIAYMLVTGHVTVHVAGFNPTPSGTASPSPSPGTVQP